MPGDIGLIARGNSELQGAAWIRAQTPQQMWQLQSVAERTLPSYELAIGLEPQARGKGVGTAILTKLIYAAAKEGVGEICLSVNKSNAVAQKLYEKVGFKVAGVGLKNYVMVVSTK